MFYHFDFPTAQKDPESAWQKQLRRERAKQEEREAKELALIDITIGRFSLGDTRDYKLNPSDKEDIAPILQTTREQYSRWERGAQEIPFHHAITLARFYKVSLDYIAGLTNKKQRR